MYDDSDNPFLSIQETADLLRVKRGTLDNLRWKGEGPAWRRHGEAAPIRQTTRRRD